MVQFGHLMPEAESGALRYSPKVWASASQPGSLVLGQWEGLQMVPMQGDGEDTINKITLEA